jgi:hypothetical protein
MAYSSPATVVTGTTITSTWGNSVKTAADYLANPPACRVYHTANQAINNNALTALAFNSERFDTNTMHDTVTNNSRITFNTAGLYIVTGSFAFALDTDYTDITGLIRMTGATTIAEETRYATGVSAIPRLTISTLYKFAVSEYVELVAYQTNTSANANNVTASLNYSPEFSAVWVGLG